MNFYCAYCRERTAEEHVHAEAYCDGRCLTASDLIEWGGNEIAIPDPFCSLHGYEVSP